MVVSGWQTKFNVSPGPGLWSLVLGHVGPDQGPDLGPGPGPELDNKAESPFFELELQILFSVMELKLLT